MFNNALFKGKGLICSGWWFPWYKCSHHGHFQAINRELGRDVRSLLSSAFGSWLQHITGFLKPILKIQLRTVLRRSFTSLDELTTPLCYHYSVFRFYCYKALLHLFILLFPMSYSSLHSTSHSTVFFIYIVFSKCWIEYLFFQS